MKIWNSYGSEHSANLVMIGKFEDVPSAEKAKEAIDRISTFAVSNSSEYDETSTQYSDELLELLNKLKLHSMLPSELSQFTYDVKYEVKQNSLVVTTDEMDVSAFLKLLIDFGAKVEVFSAHKHKESGLGR